MDLLLIKDTANNRGGIDGDITNASITFIDTATATGLLETIQLESGSISEPIIELANTSVVLQRQLTVSCYGECDAEAIVNVNGGTPPYLSYSWTPTPYSSNALGDSVMLCAGTYDVEVTDSYGCSGSTSVTVIEPPQIVIDETYHTDTLLCHGDSSGTIVVKASGGTGTLSYT